MTATFVEELVSMCRELDERRLLAEDLDVFFEDNPEIEQRFGVFQQERARERAEKIQKAHAEANARRRAR